MGSNLSADWDETSRSNANRNWMEKLDDGLSIAALSLPGTHHSASWPSTAMNRTQAWDIAKQLGNGIRFLDIQCQRAPKEKLDEDLVLQICYYAQQGISMKEVIEACVKFLARHPTEFVVMRVKEAYPHSYRDKGEFGVTLQRLLNRVTEANKSQHPTAGDASVAGEISAHTDKDPYFWRKKEVPTVKDARGKLVIMNDFMGTGEFMGIAYDGQIQDEWHVASVLATSIDWKWDKVKANLKLASAENRDSNKLHITFTSGCSSGAYPSGVADRINPKLDKFLEEHTGRKNWGYVVMDYPGLSLVTAIIHSNFDHPWGIRFLDIHCQLDSGVLQICYYAQQGIPMSDVIRACVDFLNAYPREFIVMRVNEAYRPEDQRGNAFRDCLQTLSTPSERFWTRNHLPEVSDARGRIVIMHDYKGISDSNLPYISGNIKILEDFRVATVLAPSINWKWEKVEESLKAAVAPSRNLDNVHITYTGGSSSGAYPSGVADRINPKLDAFLERNGGKRNWGYIVMVYPGLSLVNGVIASNFGRNLV